MLVCLRGSGLGVRGSGVERNRLSPIHFWPSCGPPILAKNQFWPVQFGPIHFWPIRLAIWCVPWWGPEGWEQPEGVAGPKGRGAQTQKKWGPEGWGVKKGEGPKPRKRVGPKGGAPKGGALKCGPDFWGAKISRFFCPLSRYNFHSFLPSLGGLLVELWWCLKRRAPQICTFGIFGLSCEAQAAWVQQGRGLAEGGSGGGRVQRRGGQAEGGPAEGGPAEGCRWRGVKDSKNDAQH